MSTTTARGSREQRYDQRRMQLAESALTTLGELGYARTSLREIAQNSEFTHGVVHYYFANKIELITYCVRHFKAQCVTRYDAIVAESQTAGELCTSFAAKLAETMQADSAMHRLWYDLRTQSMFEEELRSDVLDIDQALEQMIWRVITRYAELDGSRPVFDSATAYAMLDGLFQKALLAHLTGSSGAGEWLRRRAVQLLPTMLAVTSRS